MGLNYSSKDRADGSHLLSEDPHNEKELEPDNFVFKSDVPLEKQLKTQSLKNISSKVIENWINQTLSAAEHLDIPHAILKPKN